MNTAEDILIDGYAILDEIAQGGFGVVLRARHISSGQIVAIKVLHAELVGSHDIILRFRREADVIAKLRHPSVIKLFEYGRLHDGRPFIVMEHLSGANLASYIDSRGPLPPQEVLSILEPLVSALELAHAHGVVHRDIKASNVVLSEENGTRRVVLLDFGIAKLLEHSGPQITGTQHTVGSPVCMAPEQIRGQSVDARTDVYGLGSLTFHMLTGAPPFPGGSLTSMDQHLFAERPRPSDHLDITPAFDEVVVRAMNQEREQRFPGVADFLAAFRNAARSGPHMAERRPSVDSQPSIGLYVDVRADPAALHDPDDALLDDMESIFLEAAPYLSTRGYLFAYDNGDSALFVKPLSGDSESERDARSNAIHTAVLLFEKLLKRNHLDPRVRFSIYLHASDAQVHTDTIAGGQILDLNPWVVPYSGTGILASADFCRNLEVASSVISEVPRVLQIYGS